MALNRDRTAAKCHRSQSGSARARLSPFIDDMIATGCLVDVRGALIRCDRLMDEANAAFRMEFFDISGARRKDPESISDGHMPWQIRMGCRVPWSLALHRSFTVRDAFFLVFSKRGQ